jgi:glycosyltransferase involved in cell wall biosynthesis
LKFRLKQNQAAVKAILPLNQKAFKKPRLFYLAWVAPSENGGACLAMRRHFVEHDDFDLFVATSGAFHHPAIPSLRVKRHPALVRLSNTRFSRWMRQVEMVFESAHIPAEVLSAAQHFKPDAVFTVADNTLSWTAYRLARKLDVPLITNFQDWWPRGLFTLELEKPFPSVAALLDRRFHRLYQASRVAFCTSAGMREKLGPHPCAPVLYPCSAPRDPGFVPDFIPPSASRPLKLIYAGTVIKDYGRNVLRLAKALAGLPWIQFEVYGPPPDWPEPDLKWMRAEGIYRGLLPHAELISRLREADVCLAVMSFGRELELMMRTSFTTKFLEYVQFAKPVIVWGPEYCQPVRVARETGAGLSVETNDVQAVVTALESLRSPERWLKLAKGAWSAANGVFSHRKIQDVLCSSIHAAIADCAKK